jgi:hypothetical protein
MTNNKGIDCTVEDHLDEDPLINNQIWVCMSIFTPNSIKNPEGEVINTGHQVRGIKIRGVYATKEKAEKRCEEIRKFDKYHHVFIGEVGKWLPWDDDASNAEEAVYAEPKLNEMMKSYKEAQQKAEQYAQERKMKAHANAKKQKEEKNKETSSVDLQNDVITQNIIETNIKSSLGINELEEDKETLNVMSEKIKQNEQEINNDNKVVEEKEQTISKIDDELMKARQLYDELMKKYNLEK